MSACRICLEEEGMMIQPCMCKGTAKDVHPECLHKWLTISGKTDCEICKHTYEVDDTHEFVWTPIPKIQFSINEPFPIWICTFMLFTMQVFILLAGYDPKLVLLGISFVQIFFLYMLQEYIHPLTSWCLWKIFSTLGFVVGNLIINTWVYVFYEAGLTLILFVYTYAYLVYKQSYHRIRYIYYEEMP